MAAHVLYGDSFLVPQELKRLEAEAGASGLLEANRHRLRAEQVKPAELIRICSTIPFMDPRRLVVVEGLLATTERRAGGRGRTRGRRGEASLTPTLGGWEALAEALPGLPETTLLVFVDGPLQESNPLLQVLRPLAQVQALAAPTGEALARWIKTTAQQKGAGISPAAIACLADLVGNDLWTLDREVEKLSLYAAGRAIDESNVRELVSQVREANIFSAVDAILEGRPGVALRLLHQLRQDGRELSYIVSMIERQLRLLALARDLTERGVPQSELGRRLGLPSQFVLRKTLEQSRKHSWGAISWRYQRLLEADLAVKRGLMEPDMALELLVGEMASQR